MRKYIFLFIVMISNNAQSTNSDSKYEHDLIKWVAVFGELNEQNKDNNYGLNALCSILIIQKRYGGKNEDNVKIFDGLKKEQLLSDIDIELVKNEKVQVGMSEKALYCSWGTPIRINTDSRGYTQHVYNDAYVYTLNGIVNSWEHSY